MTPGSILISGYYGFANAGDEAILSVIVAKLRAHCPDARLVVISGNPASTAADHDVDAVLWSDPRAIADRVRESSLVIVGGGGLFHDYSGFIPDGLFTEGNWGLGFHVTAALMAALFDKPLMVYAAGVGPLFSEHGRMFTRAAAMSASAISVRDGASAELLRQIGVPDARISADPAFSLAPAPFERIREIYASEGLDPQARRAAVVVRHWDFGVHPVFWQEQMAAGLDRLLDQSAALGVDEILFVPFQRLNGHSEDDAGVARRIHAGMRFSHTGEAKILNGVYTPAELCGILQSSRMVIGMRLHSLIFAASGKTPMVSIAYDPKVSDVIEHLGLGDTVIDLGALTAEALVNRARNVLAGWSARNGELEASLERLRQATDCDALTAAELFRDQPPAPALTTDVIQLLRTAVLAQLRAYERLKRSAEARTGEFEHRVAKLEDSLEEARAKAEAEALLSEERVLALQKRASRIVPLETELDRAKSTLEEQASLHAQRLADLETTNKAKIDALRAEQDALQQQLSDSLDSRRISEQAFRDYRERLKHWRIKHRNQRAWQVMLVVRKGYTLAFQRGWKGRLHFLFWLPGLLIGRTGDLSEYDLRWEDDSVS
jgi:polysaccharide pyruvyl transferase CsaB